VLRRQIARPDETLAVGALLAVVVEGEASDAQIDAVVQRFQAEFVPGDSAEQDSGPAPQKVELDGHRVRYFDLGEGGTPLVLIHGFCGDLNNWMFNHPALAIRLSDCTRAGASRARFKATAPPMECPARCTRPRSR
jgi:pyruvate dehydrogenase E2 component (dihydrolipoamide acetyltransferase)